MTDFFDLAEDRRSVRAYLDTPVTEEQVQKVIACGHEAPSGGNLKEWRFIVIRDPEQKRRVVAATYSRNNESNPPQAWLAEAPVLIAVAADLSIALGRYGRHGIDSLVYLDCGCAVQNMLLAACALGLSSCFISGFREHQMGEALGLPPELEAVALLPLGYARVPGVKRPCAPAEDVTFFERFGEGAAAP